MVERFIYAHYRRDTGECFYVGKGSKNPRGTKPETVYFRAYARQNRNPDWHEIVDSVGFTVRIVQENIFAHEEASSAEKMWVAQFWDWNTLVNRTRGGCGTNGYRHRPDVIERIVAKTRGRRGELCKNSHPVYAYLAATGDYIGFYGSASLAGEALPVNRASIDFALKRTNHHARDHLFYSSYQGERVPPLFNPPRFNGPKQVEQFNADRTLMTVHESVTEAANATGISAGGIRRCCKQRQLSAQGYHWRFKSQGPLDLSGTPPRRKSGRKRRAE